MNLQLASLLVIAIAVVVGVVRSLRAVGKRRWPLVLGQILMGLALVAMLYPPSTTRDPETAMVITAGATDEQLASIDRETAVIVLPEAPPGLKLEARAADLASALRQHPGIGSLRILGDGLTPRDRDAVANVGVAFEPSDPPRGLVELQVPETVTSGTVWPLAGRVAGVADARVELLDRSDAVVAAMPVDADGQFQLSTVAKASTRLLYRLRVLDANDGLVEELPVALASHSGDSLRTRVVAGAPDAELKYLRRWIVDAGHALGSQIALSRGIEQRQSAANLDPATLAETDLLIVDERAWAGLPLSARQAVRSAVESGMGLLLRVTGPIPGKVAEEWSAMGFTLEDARLSRSVGLHGKSAGRDQGPGFTRRPLLVKAPDSVSLLQAADGSDLARWRAMGQGRIGIILLLDSFRMPLDGDREGYGTLWSNVFRTLGRARAEAGVQLPRFARLHERSVICGLQPGAEIVDADGTSHELLVGSDANSCAAWWPARAGWHELTLAARRFPIHVLEQGEAVTLQRMATREATLALVREAPLAQGYSRELPRWPFFLFWLCVSALVWWTERRGVPPA